MKKKSKIVFHRFRDERANFPPLASLSGFQKNIQPSTLALFLSLSIYIKEIKLDYSSGKISFVLKLHEKNVCEMNHP